MTNRGSDDLDRTIGLGSGSNGKGAIFALTFAAIDTIVRRLVESNLSLIGSHYSPFAARGKIPHDSQRRYP